MAWGKELFFKELCQVRTEWFFPLIASRPLLCLGCNIHPAPPLPDPSCYFASESQQAEILILHYIPSLGYTLLQLRLVTGKEQATSQIEELALLCTLSGLYCDLEHCKP